MTSFHTIIHTIIHAIFHIIHTIIPSSSLWSSASQGDREDLNDGSTLMASTGQSRF